MRKKITILIISVLAIIAGVVAYLEINARLSFSCESNYSIVQQINNVTIRSEGVVSAELSGSTLFIGVDGLLTNENKKYIVARSIDITIEKYNNSFHLFRAVAIRIIRHNSDNIPDDIAQQILFGEKGSDKIIYINRINDDVLLFGNQLLPQYGCKRK